MNLQEQILDGYDTLIVIALDTSYKILTINKSGVKLLKQMYGQEAKKGDCILDLFKAPSSKSLAKSHFDRALAGESFTVTRPFESGKIIRYYDIMYAPLLKNEEIYGFSALVVDITEKTKHEEERVEANEMYRRLFVTSKDAIMTLEPPSWKFTTGNERILEMFKVRDMAEWTSMGPWQVSPEVQPDGELSSEKAKRMIQTAMTNGSHYFEWTHQRMNGESFPATVLLTRVNFSERQFLQATVRDITKEKQVEHALHAQADLQKLLMKISTQYINAPLDQVESIIQKSLEELGDFVDADRAYIFDYNPEEQTIDNTFEWCSEEVTPFIDKLQGLPLHTIPELTYPDSRHVYIPDTSLMPEGPSKDITIEQEIKSILTVPLIQDGKYVGLVGFDSVKNHHTYTEKEIALLRIFSNMLVNIKIRSEKETELAKLLSRTKDQNKRLKEFSYITSHNMRASVANMIGLSQMIQVVPDNEDYLDMLKTTTQKLDNSITNINQLINFENGNDVLEKVDCNLSEAVQRVLKLTNQIIKKKEVDLHVNIDDFHVIKAFPAYLDSIFHNLITNALKYGITDQSKKLDIYASQESAGTTVFIKDQGLGIDLNKYHEKMFKLGTRLHDTSDGQGLGLFMTKRHLEAMGGQIEVESKVNQGTTFKLHFQN
ncbi:PAS domain-containing sensor histidine kinase [Reichenbachiella faecimaris]|nr:ATP-binding protein [Reichenbachiella faecimaris]